MASIDDSLGKKLASEIFRSIKLRVKDMPINSIFKQNIVDEIISAKFLQQALFSRLTELGKGENKPTPEVIKMIIAAMTPMTCAALGLSYPEQQRTKGAALHAISANDDRKNPLSIQNKVQYYILIAFLNNEAFMKLFLEFKMEEDLRAAILLDFEEAKKYGFKPRLLLELDLVEFNEVPMFLLLDFDKQSIKFFQTTADLFQFLDEDEAKAKSHYEGLEDWGYSREEAEVFKRRMHAKIEETYELKRNIAKQLESDYKNVLRQLDRATGDEREDLLEEKKALEAAMQKHKAFCDQTSADNLEHYIKKHFNQPEHKDLHDFHRIQILERNNQVLSAEDHAVKRRIAADPKARQLIQHHDNLVFGKMKNDIQTVFLNTKSSDKFQRFADMSTGVANQTPNTQNLPIMKVNSAQPLQTTNMAEPTNAKTSQVIETTPSILTTPTPQQEDTSHHTKRYKSEVNQTKSNKENENSAIDLENFDDFIAIIENYSSSRMLPLALKEKMIEIIPNNEALKNSKSESDRRSLVSLVNKINPALWDDVPEEREVFYTTIKSVPGLKDLINDPTDDNQPIKGPL